VHLDPWLTGYARLHRASGCLLFACCDGAPERMAGLFKSLSPPAVRCKDAHCRGNVRLTEFLAAWLPGFPGALEARLQENAKLDHSPTVRELAASTKVAARRARATLAALELSQLAGRMAGVARSVVP
jgi:hypothetical protein